jgi:hypothetical protein
MDETRRRTIEQVDELLGATPQLAFTAHDPGEVALEVFQPLSDRRHAGEVVRGQHLALNDREVDFDLVEPACMDRRLRMRSG